MAVRFSNDVFRRRDLLGPFLKGLSKIGDESKFLTTLVYPKFEADQSPHKMFVG